MPFYRQNSDGRETDEKIAGHLQIDPSALLKLALGALFLYGDCRLLKTSGGAVLATKR